MWWSERFETDFRPEDHIQDPCQHMDTAYQRGTFFKKPTDSIHTGKEHILHYVK